MKLSYQKVIRHLSRKTLQLNHTLTLQILDGIIICTIFRFECGPRKENMLENLQHESGVFVERSS